MKTIKNILAVSVICSLTACVDDGENGSDGNNGLNSLVKQTDLAVGDSNCFNGGIQVDSGLDSNNDGDLQSSEITATKFLCNPAVPTIVSNLQTAKASYGIQNKVNQLSTASFSEGGRKGNDVNLTVGFGSGAYRYSGDPENVFYTISDRGPNIKCKDAKEIIGLEKFCLKDGNEVKGKIFPVTSFAPSIYKWALVENSNGDKQAQIVETITLKDKDGKDITGISNPLKFADGTTNTELAFASDGSQLAFDPAGLDPEAMVKLSDGTFWIAEEYGASILHVAADGKIVKRVVPQGVETQLAEANYTVEGLLPAIYHKRKLNRGIESIAVSPDEQFLYFIMQSPLQNPDYKNSRHVRLMKYALNGSDLGAAVGEYVYQIDLPATFGNGEAGDNGKKQKDVKVSEMVAIGTDDLIVLERISKTTKLYRINLATADNILNTTLSSDGVIAKESAETKSLESVYNLQAVNATPVAKSLVFNSLNDAPDLAKKIEGIALLNDEYVMLINDNDFGIEGEATKVEVLKIGQQLKSQQSHVAQKPELNLIGRYKASTGGEGAAEIVQYHQASQSVFAINGDVGNRIEVTSLAGLTSTPLANPLTATNLTGTNYDLPNSVTIGTETISIADVNSIAIHDNKLAVAIAHQSKNEQAGVVLFYTLNANGTFDVNNYVVARVGVLPDNVAFSPNGEKIVVADEGQAGDVAADDQKGTISIIDVVNNVMQTTATTLNFDAYNTQTIEGINQNPDAIDFAHAAEPEYVAITADSKKAYVTLQEINAVAIVDLQTKKILGVKGLGFKDHSLAENALDASDKDDAVNIKSYDNLFGMYQPDTIVSYEVNGKTYLVTANEGDAGDGFQDVDERVKKLTLDATEFPEAATLQTDEELGRLKVVPYLGKNANDEHEKLYAFGARSFSIWNDKGELVFDSASDFEKITAGLYGINFNNDEDENDPDTRSDAKGPEPEALSVGQVGERTYAFVGFERMGGIAMYDITDPYGVQFITYTNNRDFTNIANGDLAPEGMAFIPADQSPTNKPLLVVGNEISGTVAVYQIQ